MADEVALGNPGVAPAALVRGGGLILVAGGLLLVVATALHPSQETPVSILALEGRLIGSHAVYFVSYVLILLGLPALYVSDSKRMGRWG